MLSSLAQQWGLAPWVLVLSALVVACLVFLALCYWHPVLSGRFPRAAALFWPHAFLIPLLALLVIACATGLIWATTWFGIAESWLWGGLQRKYESLAFIAWLWPWLPMALAYMGLAYLAARLFSPRVFHTVFVGMVLCAALAVSLSGDGAPDAFLSPDARNVPPPSSFYPPSSEVWAGVSRQVPPSREFTTIVQERFGERVFSRAAHRSATQPDWLAWAGLGVGLLLAFRWLETVNSRLSILPLEVGPFYDERKNGEAHVEDADALEDGVSSGNGNNRRTDIERLLMETLQKNSPHTHTPPRVPGGSLLQWRELVSLQSDEKVGWVASVAAFLLKAFIPPKGLRLTGAVVARKRRKPEGAGYELGLRIRVENLRTHSVELATTLWGKHLDQLTRRAAYAFSELALELCPSLPPWVYWRESDGVALADYWKGVEALKVHPYRVEYFEQRDLEKAYRHFTVAARKSHGNGLARLQYGELLEAKGNFTEAIEVYLDLVERYPTLIVAKFRLALAASYVDRWAPDGDVMKLIRMPESADGEGLTRGHCSLPSTSCPSDEYGREAWMYWDHFFRFLVSSRVVKPKEAEALNESVYHFATGSFCGGDGTSSVQMKNWFHAFADRQLRELRRSVNWSVMWWCARSTSERRRFWTTILWPPERRALHAKGMRAAHCCVHLRQRLLMAHEACASDLHAFVLSAPDWRSELAGRTGKPHSATVPIQVHDQQTRKWLRVASRMTREARHLSPGYRPGWGMVHYNLACYYALCMMPGLRERQGASGKVEKFEDPTGIHDYWAQRVVFHLSRALRDPSGPLGAGALWWIGRDPDLRAFRRHWRFGDWKSEIQLPDKDAPGERAPRPRAPGGAFRHSGLWAVSPHH